MSYDLFLYRAEGRAALALEEADAAVGSMPNMARWKSESGTPAFAYQNPKSGVYFNLFWSPQPDLPPTVKSSGPVIEFNINYMRPTFFAMEAMPVVVRIAEQLALQIGNPQAGDESKLDWTADELVDSWRKQNQWAVGAYRAQAEQSGQSGSMPVYCPVERTTYWWKYALATEAIELSLGGEDVFVPKVWFIKRPSRNSAELAATWAAYFLTVFPEVDLVIAGRTRRRFLGLSARTESGLIEFPRIREALGDSLARVEGDACYYVFRGPGPSPEVVREFDGLIRCPQEPYVGVAPDQVVDVES